MAQIASRLSIPDFLKNVKSIDKDLRYMALSDLERKLEGGKQALDWTNDTPFMTAVLESLQDASSDIAAMGVKCLGLVVATDSNPKTDYLAQDLGKRLLVGKKNGNTDLVSMALKAVISATHGESGSKAIVENLMPSLQKAVVSEDGEVQNAALEALQVLAAKHGALMSNHYGSLTTILVDLLKSGKAAARKRSIQCLGTISAFLDNEKVSSIFLNSLQSLDKSKTESSALTYVHVLSSLSRSSGWRLGKQFQPAIKAVISRSEQAEEGNDDLREGCLQALEAFVSYPLPDTSSQILGVLQAALENLSYDPNYADDMSIDGDDDDEDAEEDSEPDEISDDEDQSWRVRKAAARLLACLLRTYPHLLTEIYSQASKALISRFKEREENVRLEILSTFAELIAQVGRLQARSQAPGALSEGFANDYPTIVKAAGRQLSDKSMKVKSGIIRLLKELLVIDSAKLAGVTSQFTPGILSALKDGTAGSINLRIQILEFFAQAFKKIPFPAWSPKQQEIVDAILRASKDKYYRIVSSALSACEEMIVAMRPEPGSSQTYLHKTDVQNAICSALEARLLPHDQDQEVKDATISCTAALLAAAGDLIPSAQGKLLKVLAERLTNETTRLPAVKAFIRIAESPLQLRTSSIHQELVSELLSYLQKANRVLKQASLDALDAVLSNAAFADDLPVKKVAAAVARMVDEADLLLTAAAIHIGVVLLRSHNNTGPAVASNILPKALKLAQSPLLQAAALSILKEFLIAVLDSKIPGVTLEDIQSQLIQAGSKADVSRASQLSIAQCIACISKPAGQLQALDTITRLMPTLKKKPGSPSEKYLALVSIGEIGRLVDTSSHKTLFPEIVSFLSSSDEETKSAAILALGAVSSGNMPVYLPLLLRHIQDQDKSPNQQYLLLQALHELLCGSQAEQLPTEYKEQATSMLLANASAEEDCRNVVAGCLGRIALLSPQRTVPLIHQQVGTGNPDTRVIMISALRVAVVDQQHQVDSLLASALPHVFLKLTDSEWRVRRAAVQLLSITLNHKPDFVRDVLGSLIPQVYAQTVPDPALMKQVELGPFKHTIDEGLELRKAAFECMDFLLENAAEFIQFNSFIEHLRLGLADVYDIKMPCHLLLAKVASRAGEQLLPSLSQLVPTLEKTLKAKLKGEAVKQEEDRNEDMVRSCLRAIEVCSRIPNVESCQVFQEVMSKTVLQPPLESKFKAVANERAELEGRTSKPS